MIHEILPVGALQCNCSILGDEASGEAIVVDPGDEIPRILAVLQRHKLTVKQILITHAHIDHIAVPRASRHSPALPSSTTRTTFRWSKMMAVQADGLDPNARSSPTDDTLDEGKVISIGAVSNGPPALSAASCTPRPYQGSVCLYLPTKALLAGDTLFAGSIGRTDLPAAMAHAPPLHPQQAASTAR